ncbi:MAG: PTS sugar transporter subunit IIA [Candidatus Omnitrophica bacterium]|nr:PTS sugar transporter subunit IIA [Candidatus Omnitrophota bacterium]
MKIMDFLCQQAISANLKASDKEGVLRELTGLLAASQSISDPDEVLKALVDREALGSTGIGHGVAIPHGKSGSVKDLVAAFGISRRGIRFEALDGEPVYIFFLLVAPEDTSGPHLKALARISRLLRDKYFRDSLISARDEQEILRVIQLEDSKKV